MSGVGSIEWFSLIAEFLFSRQGAETPAAGILEFRPPGCPPVGSPQVPAPMGTLR